MRPLSICVLGGTGFVGTPLCAQLVRDGHSVRVLTRNRERAKRLFVLPDLEVHDANVHEPAVLAQHFRGRDVVINLVGILNERGRSGSGFRHAHGELARKVVSACRSSGVTRLLHMSALRAAETAPSHYLRTKGEAERIVREESGHVQWTIFQPSVIFGPGDGFMNRFAGLLALFPALPLARAGARFAPVYVGDVVAAMVRALNDDHVCGEVFQLCGPEVFTLADLVRYVAEVRGQKRLVFGIPDAVGALQAFLMDFLPGKPLSIDNFRSLSVDSVCSENGLARLGIAPTSLRAVVPDYLGSKQRNVRLDDFRRAAGARVDYDAR
ncbi:MAG: complex I NDUFA9 subunit family protein [Steroidobacteraceae bacterium]|jgi:NADH dehydrogenase|nr:complex I NDUFA9 subunit family protein [Steroidobacteraceae bacterium]